MRPLWQPSTIIYENLEVGFARHCAEQAISWSLLAAMLTGCYFAAELCYDNGQSFLASYVIIFCNVFLPTFISYLVHEFESHANFDDIENSFISKVVTARSFCSVAIVLSIGLRNSSLTLTPYYIKSVQSILQADAITGPILRLLDIGGRFNRLVVAWLAKNKRRAFALQAGADYLLAERYTDLVKTLLLCLVFSALFPLGYAYAGLACFMNYWVDKYCFLRLYKQKPPAGFKLVQVRNNILFIQFTNCDSKTNENTYVRSPT